MYKSTILAAVTAAMFSTTAAAESQISFYAGHQSAPHSNVSGSYGNEVFDFTAGWEGKPFEMPPYWGARYTVWKDANWGIAFDTTHSKVYSDAETRTTSGFEVLEFTDGINVFTVNAVRRWQNDGEWTPYFGVGAGFAIPHVEVQVDSEAEKTFGYQFTGPAAQFHGGVEYSISDDWSVFAEYKFNYVMINADLDGPADDFLKTNVITNALNVGVSRNY